MAPEVLVVVMAVAGAVTVFSLRWGWRRPIAAAAHLMVAGAWWWYASWWWPGLLVASAHLWLALSERLSQRAHRPLKVGVAAMAMVVLGSAVVVAGYQAGYETELSVPRSTSIRAAAPLTVDVESGVDLAGRPQCSRGDQEQCLIDWFSALAGRSNAGSAYATLVGLLDDSGSPDTQVYHLHCHNVSHELGRLALNEANGDPRQALNAAGDFETYCSFGFFHGVWQELFDAETFESLRRQRNMLCDSVETDSFSHNSCYHILGHRLTQERRDDPLTAAEVCLEVEPVNDSVGSCLSGVWMELFIEPSMLEDVGRLAASDPQRALQQAGDPCGEIAADQILNAQYCWHEASMQIYWSSGKDAGIALSVCDQVNGGIYDWCVLGVGKAVALYAGHDPDETWRMCAATDDPNRCVLAVASAEASYTGSLERSEVVCGYSTVPQRCLDEAQRWGNVEAIAAVRNRMS